MLSNDSLQLMPVGNQMRQFSLDVALPRKVLQIATSSKQSSAEVDDVLQARLVAGDDVRQRLDVDQLLRNVEQRSSCLGAVQVLTDPRLLRLHSGPKLNAITQYSNRIDSINIILSNQDVRFKFNANLTGIGLLKSTSLYVNVMLIKMWAKRTICNHQNTFDRI